MRLDKPSRTSLPTDLVAVYGWQVAVEHDHVVFRSRGSLQRCPAVVDHIDGESGVTQTLADPVGQRDVILHNEHAHIHILHRPR